MVVPLNANCFTVNVSLQLLKQGLVMPCILGCLEVVPHLVEELLLIDSAVEFSESFVTLIVSDSSIMVSI